MTKLITKPLYLVARANTGRRVITFTPKPGDLVHDPKAPSGWRRQK